MFLLGISSETILKPASITEEELLDLILKLNNDTNVDGLLVQLPLPGERGRSGPLKRPWTRSQSVLSLLEVSHDLNSCA